MRIRTCFCFRQFTLLLCVIGRLYDWICLRHLVDGLFNPARVTRIERKQGEHPPPGCALTLKLSKVHFKTRWGPSSCANVPNGQMTSQARHRMGSLGSGGNNAATSTTRFDSGRRDFQSKKKLVKDNFPSFSQFLFVVLFLAAAFFAFHSVVWLESRDSSWWRYCISQFFYFGN